jgi:hypothetical protein
VSESQFQECLEVEFTAFKRVRAFFHSIILEHAGPCVIFFSEDADLLTLHHRPAKI